MSIHKRLKSLWPKGFLWKITLLNTIVIALAIALSGWAVYNTACFLVEGMGNLDRQRQQVFNATLFQYVGIFSVSGIIIGSMLHFYFTKKLVKPIRQLIDSTKQMKTGKYPEPIDVRSLDEVGELIQQYNGLIYQLQTNEQHRQKLVSDLSHEFRTPLSNLSGYLHALRSGVIEGDEELYESLYEESNRLTKMIDQLDQLKQWNYVTEKTVVTKQTVNIAEEIDQCAQMFDWKLTESNIPIHVKAESKEMLIQVEGIQQVLSNLLDNAIQYYEGEDPIILTGELRATGYRVSVAGPSKKIPDLIKDQLFDRFYRIDRSRSRETGGSGLGLAIAKEIIEHHNGKIGLKTMEAGNLFWFELPKPIS